MSISAFRFSGKRRPLAIGLSVATFTAVIVVVTVMALGTRSALGSGSGGGGTCISNTGVAPVCTFKDNGAWASFGNVSEDGCILTDAEISVYDNLSAPGRTASQSVGLYISKWDNCGGTQLSYVSDYDPNTGATTFTGAIQFSADLSTATVNGTAAMYGDDPTTQLYTATINLTFKGYGSTFNIMTNQRLRAPGYVQNVHYTGKSRTAAVSGIITDPDGNNVAALPTTNAGLGNTSGGTVQIFKG